MGEGAGRRTKADARLRGLARVVRKERLAGRMLSFATSMDGSIEYGEYSEAQLLDALSHIDRHRYPENFRKLKAALGAIGYVVDDTASGSVSAIAPVRPRIVELAVRLSPGRGPLGWIEPARNDFHLVGKGTIWLGEKIVHVSGHRLGFVLGLPLTRRIDLARDHIVNVEFASNAVRFEYHPAGRRPRAITLWVRDSATAEQLAMLLPTQRTAAFQPQLPTQIEFEERLRLRAPNTPVTVALVVLNVAVFIVTLAAGAGLLFPEGTVLIGWGSNFGPYTTDGDWWRLVTATFLHAGVLHVAFNMWALAATGPLVERFLGSVPYLFLYLIAGVAGSLASVAWQPAVNSVGASGAIFGVYGALLAALLRGDQGIPWASIAPLRNSTLIFTAYALAIGFAHKGVDNAAHLGGLITGFIIGLVLVCTSSLNAVERRTLRSAAPFVAALVVGAVILGAGGTLAKRRASSLEGEALYWQVRHWLIRNEAVAIKRQQEIWQLAREDKIDDVAFADAIESSVLSIWREADRRLRMIELPAESLTSSALEYLRELTESRRTAHELCVRGARAHDSEVMGQCVEELARGDRLANSRRDAPEK